MIELSTHDAGARTTPDGRGRALAPARRRSARRSLCTVAAFAFFLPAAHGTSAEPSDVPAPERLSEAPPVGHLLAPGLVFSGYATLQALVPDDTPLLSQMQEDRLDDPQYSHRARLDVSHLSGIAWWEPSPAWKVLAEVDMQDVVQLPGHSDVDDGRTSAPYASLERLYVDYHFSDSLGVRAGKFLTPIGRWNQEHSDPQTWTVLRPFISQSAFPTTTTGVMGFGSLPAGAQWINWQAYVSGHGDWRANPHGHPFERAWGARLYTDLDPQLQVGMSYSRFVENDYAHTRFQLTGLDATWSLSGAELSAEAILRRSASGAPGREDGWFAQAALPLVERWWAVVRLEAYRRAIDETAYRTALAGLVYRSGDHWVLKAEWAQPSGEGAGLPSGLLASLTFVY